LLIVGDRGRYRAFTLELLQQEGSADPTLLRFVDKCYKARAVDFATSEGEYLKGLQAAYESGGPLRGPICDALAWFAALPDHPGGPRFRAAIPGECRMAQNPHLADNWFRKPAQLLCFITGGDQGLLPCAPLLCHACVVTSTSTP